MFDVQESTSEKLGRLLNKSAAPRFGRSGAIVTAIVILCFLGMCCLSLYTLRQLGQAQRTFKNSVKHLKRRVTEVPFVADAEHNVLSSSHRLSAVPYGEDLGIVLDVKRVEVRHVPAPYNASLAPAASGSGYDLFFRYDILSQQAVYAPFFSHIGVVHLNDQFMQEDREFKKIHLPSEYAEDPRVLLCNDQLYLFYNSLHENNVRGRFMQVASLDRHTFDTLYNTCLDLNLQWIEKNWSPFVYGEEGTPQRLFIEYRLSPRKLFQLPDPRCNEMENMILPANASYCGLPMIWRWGELRGGTPAQRIGNEYLAFFHSAFSEQGINWYVMGAYTFEAQPPFRLTGISEWPLLFRGIFDSPFRQVASLEKRVIFPSGLLIEEKEGRELIHLSCGENDSAVKIVTLDKERLLKHMIRFEKASP